MKRGVDILAIYLAIMCTTTNSAGADPAALQQLVQESAGRLARGRCPTFDDARLAVYRQALMDRAFPILLSTSVANTGLATAELIRDGYFQPLDNGGGYTVPARGDFCLIVRRNKEAKKPRVYRLNVRGCTEVKPLPTGKTTTPYIPRRPKENSEKKRA